MNIYELDFRFGSPHGLPTFRKKSMDPVVGAAIIGGVAGLFSSGSSGKSAVEAQRLANESNERLAREQREWSTQMIREQNEYNSPVAQRERYEAAGINPFMAMQSGSLTSGNQEQTPSYQRANIQSAAPLILQSGIARADIFQRSVSQIYEGLVTQADTFLKAAQAANTETETSFYLQSMNDRLRQVNLMTTNLELQNTKMERENDLLKVQVEIQQKFGLDTAQWNLNQMVQQVSESLAREGLLTAQGEWTVKDIGRIDAQINLYGQQAITESYKRLNLVAGAENQRAQAGLAGAQTGLVTQQTRLTATEADLRDSSMPFLLSAVKADAAMKRAQQRLLNNEAGISDVAKKYRIRDVKANSWRNVFRLGNDAFDTFTKPQRHMMDMMEQGTRSFGNLGIGASSFRGADRYSRYSYNNFNNY